MLFYIIITTLNMKNFIEIVGNKFLEKYMVHVASKKTSTTYTCLLVLPHLTHIY